MDKIHNHEVAGSIPAPATKEINELQRCSSFFFFEPVKYDKTLAAPFGKSAAS